MQVVVALPGWDEIQREGGVQRSLLREVCGVPLLARVVATARKSGGTKVLLLFSKDIPAKILHSCLAAVDRSSLPVDARRLDKAFDCESSPAWQEIVDRLDAKFVWLPWQTVVDRTMLAGLIAMGGSTSRGLRFSYSVAHLRQVPVSEQKGDIRVPGACPQLPAVVVTEQLALADLPSPVRENGVLSRYLASPLDLMTVPRAPGMVVRSAAAAREAERELVRRSGKESDGIYSKFNRWVCRPAVRWLAKTAVTPNMVTFSGLVVAMLSAYWFAQGYWRAYVLGAVLFFITVLLDEIDGMLARVTSRDSAFGTWLESFVDYMSYILMFAGLTVGLYRQSGALWLWLGGLLLFGSITSILVVSNQRKLATSVDAPHEYRQRLHRRLEGDSANIVSRVGRHLEFLIRKPAYGHFVLIFVLLGGVKTLFVLTAFGANVVWVIALHFNRLFRPTLSERTKARVEGGV